MADKRPVDPKLYTTDYVKSDFDQMTFMGNPHIDALTSAIQALGAEVWTSRRRLYVIEALMAKKIAVTPASIQTYVPTSEEQAQWKADRDRLVGGIYAPFMRVGEINFPSKQSQGYDPHREPAVARRDPAGVGLNEGPKGPPSIAKVMKSAG